MKLNHEIKRALIFAAIGVILISLSFYVMLDGMYNQDNEPEYYNSHITHPDYGLYIFEITDEKAVGGWMGFGGKTVDLRYNTSIVRLYKSNNLETTFSMPVKSSQNESIEYVSDSNITSPICIVDADADNKVSIGDKIYYFGKKYGSAYTENGTIGSIDVTISDGSKDHYLFYELYWGGTPDSDSELIEPSEWKSVLKYENLDEFLGS